VLTVERQSRFWSQVVKTDSCHLWTGYVHSGGYGRVYFHEYGKVMRAHRVAWEIRNGPVPDGLMVLHKCRNRNCVNVEHLYLGTARENGLDAVRDGTAYLHYKGVTHCKRGHEFTPENTRRGHGKRVCRKCHSAYAIAHRRAKRLRERPMP
jgi:hypothetical protein